MAGTRTAPTVSDITQTTIGVTIHLMDASGDLTTDYVVVPALDLVDVEAFAVAYQATTNATVYKVSVTQEWEGAQDADNAVQAFRAEVQSGINMLFRDSVAGEKQVPRVVAPVSAIMQGNQDIPQLVSPLTTLATAYLTLLAGDYSLEEMQYTARRERKNNPKINT